MTTQTYQASFRTDAFRKALVNVNTVCPADKNLPVTSHFLLEIGKTTTTASKAKPGTAVSVEVPTKDIKKQGTIVLPEIAAKIARELDGEIIEILDGDGETGTRGYNGTRLTCGSAKFLMFSPDPNSYLDFRHVSEETKSAVGIEVPADRLKSLFELTKFATSTEQARWVLSAIQIEADSKTGVVRGVATTGHHISLFEFDCPATDIRLLIDRRTAESVIKLIDAYGPDTVTLLTDGHLTTFRVGPAVLTNSIPTGTFPDYTKILPQTLDYSATVPADRFETALRQVQTCSGEIKAVWFEIDEQKIEVRAKDELNDASSVIPVTAASANAKIKVVFNVEYLLNFARLCANEIRIKWNTAEGVWDFGCEVDGFRWVCMPMRM